MSAPLTPPLNPSQEHSRPLGGKARSARGAL